MDASSNMLRYTKSGSQRIYGSRRMGQYREFGDLQVVADNRNVIW
jgi:hypothetical protein